MSVFRSRLAELQGRRWREADRQWVFVPYDQLSHRIGPLARLDPSEAGVVLVESAAKARRRPYHRQKLALVLTNLRHYALEQARRGVAVRHVATEGSYRAALDSVVPEVGTLQAMRPAERELRRDVAPLVEDGSLEIVPHEGWITDAAQFRASQDGPPWRMDAFYRHVRRETGLLMEDGSPAGGKYSFDPENRETWDGDPAPPSVPRFDPDEVTLEVARLVEERFPRHPGRLRPDALPASASDAGAVWQRAKDECLRWFGPYQDAMSRRSSSLFHTRISPLLHLHRLLPRDVVEEVSALDLPLRSREGFIRQVLGWREFVRHVHRETDGFRELPDGPAPVQEAPGDGGWSGWRGEEWTAGEDEATDGGAAPAALGADAELPAAWWGEPSGLECLDRVVEQVWEEGYGHHITRLMVLSNIARLLDVSPRELTDWFWVAYVDAYDWVVEPNVLGMGSFGAGDLMTTKPYVSGAAYIDRMGDFCGACAFDPSDDCPLTPMYWAFLERHRDRLEDVPRMRLMLGSAGKRSDDDRRRDRATFRAVHERLSAGERLEPDALAEEVASRLEEEARDDG